MGIFSLFKGKGKTPQTAESVETGLPRAVPPEAEEPKTFRDKVESLISEKAGYATPKAKELMLGWAGTVDRIGRAFIKTKTTITDSGHKQRVELEPDEDPNLLIETMGYFTNILGKDFSPDARYTIKENWDIPQGPGFSPLPMPTARAREEVDVDVYGTQVKDIWWVVTRTKFIQRNGHEEEQKTNVICRSSSEELAHLRDKLKDFDSRAYTMLSQKHEKVPVPV